MAPVFGSPVMEAAAVAALSGIALWAGRTIYRRAYARHEEVAERIAQRKRPRLRSVLYEIFWLPLILLGMVGFVRVSLAFFPSTAVVDAAVFVLDKLVILVLVLLSINVIREVVRSAGTEDVVPEEKEG